MTRHQFFLILALLLTACAPSVADRAHDRAGELMQEYPDSALAILSSLDSAAINTDARRARHALYTLCARNKQGHYIDSADAPQINIFQAYYNGRKDATRDRMLASYYNALLILSRGLYGDGIIELLKTRDMALALDDKLQLGLIYRNIADAYTDMNDYKSALHNRELSLFYFERSGVPVYIPYAVNDLAIANNNVGCYEEAIRIGKEAYRMAVANCDTILISDASSLLGMSYYALGDNSSAINVLTKLDSLGIPHTDISDYRNLGYLYVDAGDFNKAEEYSRILHGLGNPDGLLDYKLAIHCDRYTEALKAIVKDYNITDSIVKRMFSQDISLQISSHYNTQLQLSAAKAKAEQSRVRYLIVVIVLAVICFVLLVLLLYRKKLMDELNFMNRINELRKDIEESETNIKELQKRLTTATASQELSNLYLQLARKDIKEIFTSRSEILNHLCSTYYGYSGTAAEKNKIYNEAMQQIGRWRNDTEMLLTLENTINRFFDNLIDSLRSDFPDLKEEDVRLYMYVVAGLTNCTIGVLFDKSTEFITRRKSKLKLKLSSSYNKEKYISFFRRTV